MYNNKLAPLALHQALEKDFADFATLLNHPDIEHCINQQDSEGNTPLHIAAQNNHVNFFYILNHKKHLVNKLQWIPNNEGDTPAHLAAIFGNCDALSWIICLDEQRPMSWNFKANYHILNQSNHAGLLPIHYAATLGFRDDNAQKLWRLLSQQNNPHVQSADQQLTPLHNALIVGVTHDFDNDDSIQHFLDQLSPRQMTKLVNKQNKHGLSAYDLATSLDKPHLAKRLEPYLDQPKIISISNSDDLRLKLMNIVNDSQQPNQNKFGQLQAVIGQHSHLLNTNTINIDQSLKGNLLHWACYHKLTPIVEALLNHPQIEPYKKTKPTNLIQKMGHPQACQVSPLELVVKNYIGEDDVESSQWLQRKQDIAQLFYNYSPALFKREIALLDPIQFNNTTNTTHFQIMRFMKQAGYPTTEGYCFGYSVLYSQAFFGGKLDEFRQRINTMIHYNEYYPLLAGYPNQKQHETSLFDYLAYLVMSDCYHMDNSLANKLTDLQAFCDLLSLNQNPEFHRYKLVDHPCTQSLQHNEMKSNLPHITTNESPAHVGTLSNYYTPTQFQKFLNDLVNIAYQHNITKLGVLTGTNNHATSIYYDGTANQPWLFSDIEQWPDKHLTDSRQVTEYLWHSFNPNSVIGNTSAPISNTVLVDSSQPKQNQEAFKAHIHTWNQEMIRRYQHLKPDQQKELVDFVVRNLGRVVNWTFETNYLDWLKTLSTNTLKAYEQQYERSLISELIFKSNNPLWTLQYLSDDANFSEFQLNHSQACFAFMIRPKLNHSLIELALEKHLIEPPQPNARNYYLAHLLLGAALHPGLDTHDNQVLDTVRHFLSHSSLIDHSYFDLDASQLGACIDEQIAPNIEIHPQWQDRYTEMVKRITHEQQQQFQQNRASHSEKASNLSQFSLFANRSKSPQSSTKPTLTQTENGQHPLHNLSVQHPEKGPEKLIDNELKSEFKLTNHAENTSNLSRFSLLANANHSQTETDEASPAKHGTDEITPKTWTIEL